MKVPHLLRVRAAAGAFAPLVAAARGAGLRVGWLDLGTAGLDLGTAGLDLGSGTDLAGTVPPGLEEAAGAGVMRAVGVAPGRTVAVKPLAGPAVLRDLLREHFRGCALVLVRAGAVPSGGAEAAPGGVEEAPALVPEGDGWRLEPPGGAPRRLTTERLLARLRRPRPW